MKNKFVAHSAVMKEGVREIFGSGVGELFVVGGDGKVRATHKEDAIFT